MKISVVVSTDSSWHIWWLIFLKSLGFALVKNLHETLREETVFVPSWFYLILYSFYLEFTPPV